MDPVSASAGKGLAGGSFVIGAIINAVTSYTIAYQNRKHQENLLQKQQDFTVAVEEKRFARAAELQREIAALQHENALRLQNDAFEQKRQMESYKRFCDNVWPLNADPDFYVDYLKKIYSPDMMPLQIIVPATLPRDSFAGIDTPLTEFFSTAYSVRSGNPAFYYSQGWKADMSGRNGNAQVTALHSVLAGLPTLILSLQKTGDTYSGVVSFWGIGDMDLPESKSIFSISQKALDADILRKDADQTISDYQKYNIPLPEEKNIQTRLAELKRKTELTSRGNIPQEGIQNLLNREFASLYVKAGKEDLIQNERNRQLTVLLEITSAVFTDAYYLTTYNIAPRIPALCANNPDFQNPEVIGFLQQTFSGILASMEADKLNSPLRYALLADSFGKNGFEQIAREYSDKAVVILREMVKAQAEFAPQHLQAIELLKNTPYPSRGILLLAGEITALTGSKDVKQIEASRLDEGSFSAIPLEDGVFLEMVPVFPGCTRCLTPSFRSVSLIPYLGSIGISFPFSISLNKLFYLGKDVVTQRQWQVIMGNNPSFFAGKPDNPVENICWHDAMNFCDMMNKRFKPFGWRFTLATEAQWTYAVLKRMIRPGDMKEWCLSIFKRPFPQGEDPDNLSDLRSARVICNPRINPTELDNTWFRLFECPNNFDKTIGFRLALVPVQ